MKKKSKLHFPRYGKNITEIPKSCSCGSKKFVVCCERLFKQMTKKRGIKKRLDPSSAHRKTSRSRKNVGNRQRL